MLPEALAQTSMFEREWQVHLSHKQFAMQQTTASVVWLLALDFIFTRCVFPCPQNFNIGCCASEKPLRLIAHRRVRFFTFMCVSTLVLSRSLYRSHVLTTFLGPVLGAMMKQVCWHSPCHCFLMLALLRPSRRTRQNRSRQQSAASGC